MEERKSDIRFFLVMTEEERGIIKKEAERRGMTGEESNIIREALRLYFERYGALLPTGAFADRKRGVKPGKESRLEAVDETEAA